MKAVMMLSGGLDSLLALKLVLEQGIEAHALHFTSAFSPDRSAEGARRAAGQMGVPLTVEDMTEGLLQLVHTAPHGRGAGMNPCIDCRIMQLRLAKELMTRLGAGFVVTGEVLGERPMSQRRGALEVIERDSGLEGLIVRPLCALALEPSRPELEGWVDRSRLLGITGRRRTPQIELAARLGITEYPQPAGGCRLTEPGYARRMRDLVAHGGAALEDLPLLPLGRHFRPAPGALLVVSRTEQENAPLEAAARPGDRLLRARGLPGPTALLRGEADARALRDAASITARYGKGRTEPLVTVVVTGAQELCVEVPPATQELLDRVRI